MSKQSPQPCPSIPRPVLLVQSCHPTHGHSHSHKVTPSSSILLSHWDEAWGLQTGPVPMRTQTTPRGQGAGSRPGYSHRKQRLTSQHRTGAVRGSAGSEGSSPHMPRPAGGWLGAPVGPGPLLRAGLMPTSQLCPRTAARLG